MNKKLSKKKKLIIGTLLSAIFLTGCSEGKVAATNVKSSETKSEKKIDLSLALSNAEEIEIKEKLISIGVGYDVYADDVLVGEITGESIKTDGDTFKLKDLYGNVIKSEKQITRKYLKLDRMAEVYDKNNDISGYIREQKIKDMFSWGYKFHFYNKAEKEIGYTKQEILSSSYEYEVYDMKGNLDYLIKEEVPSTELEYEIEVHDTSNIPVEDVTLYAAIQSEITKSDREKEVEKKKTSSTIKKAATVVGAVVNKANTTNKNNVGTTTNKNSTNTTLNLNKDNSNKTTSSSSSSKTNNKLNLNKNNKTSKTNSKSSNTLNSNKSNTNKSNTNKK